MGQISDIIRSFSTGLEQSIKEHEESIKELNNIKNLKRIRYTTSHPKDMTEDLINCYRDCEKLMPFLHLPIQSGSDKILKEMNRKHDREYYLSIINKLKDFNKDIKISSDFIVGYPSESQ